MKTKVHIWFEARDIPGEAAAILVPSGCGPDVTEILDGTVQKIRSIWVIIRLDEDDERVAKVLALLEKYGVKDDTTRYIEYSEEDRQNARILHMRITDLNESFHAAIHHGTKYDLTEACAGCGTGARQTSALYVDGNSLPKIRKHRALGSGQSHFVVDGGMVKKLKDAGLTGISFGDVRARLLNGKWSSVARDQILIEHVMPPMHGELTVDDEEQLCQVCRRGGFADFLKKRYHEEDLVGMQDFNLTWEWFGHFFPEDKERGRGVKRPNPEVLVTPRVMNIFRDAGVKTFQWTPVGIDE